MNPATVTAWISVVQALAPYVENIGALVQKWITEAHTTLTPDEIAAAYQTIMSDDAVRAALAQQAAGQTPPTTA